MEFLADLICTRDNIQRDWKLITCAIQCNGMPADYRITLPNLSKGADSGRPRPKEAFFPTVDIHSVHLYAFSVLFDTYTCCINYCEPLSRWGSAINGRMLPCQSSRVCIGCVTKSRFSYYKQSEFLNLVACQIFSLGEMVYLILKDFSLISIIQVNTVLLSP